VEGEYDRGIRGEVSKAGGGSELGGCCYRVMGRGLPKCNRENSEERGKRGSSAKIR